MSTFPDRLQHLLSAAADLAGPPSTDLLDRVAERRRHRRQIQIAFAVPLAGIALIIIAVQFTN